jgi:hypothetical protein
LKRCFHCGLTFSGMFYQVLLWIVSWFFCFGNLAGNFMKLICQGMLPRISPNLTVTLSSYLRTYIYLPIYLSPTYILNQIVV